MIDRRTFFTGVAGLTAMMLAGCETDGSSGPTFNLASLAPVDPKIKSQKAMVDPAFHRTTIFYTGSEKPGTIVISTKDRYLYYVLPGSRAIRYGIGVGRAGFEWSGRANVGSKQEWPKWFPPKEMIARDPRAAPYANGMEGGPENPLGARALYLYEGGKDTLYRIHGTNAPKSIGKAVSSGCIRMLNEDVADLYERVDVGTPVIVEL
ncbi:MAG TPA: L,D-transpeptidase [Hyphomicrobiales bacterium]|nr:L,D-transpeptidase [Hyphomicrobiales bacterium]